MVNRSKQIPEEFMRLTGHVTTLIMEGIGKENESMKDVAMVPI